MGADVRRHCTASQSFPFCAHLHGKAAQTSFSYDIPPIRLTTHSQRRIEIAVDALLHGRPWRLCTNFPRKCGWRCLRLSSDILSFCVHTLHGGISDTGKLFILCVDTKFFNWKINRWNFVNVAAFYLCRNVEYIHSEFFTESQHFSFLVF